MFAREVLASDTVYVCGACTDMWNYCTHTGRGLERSMEWYVEWNSAASLALTALLSLMPVL